MTNTIYKRGRVYWLKYRLQGEAGKPRYISLQTTDKQVAEKRRAETIAEMERERAGIIAPKPMREAAQRAFRDLVSEFVRDLRVRGRAPKYADNLETRLEKLAAECDWKMLRDVTPDSFVAWRSRQNLAAKTLNEYLNAASGLMNWLQGNGRIPGNPLKVVGTVEMRGRETRQRRALSEDELRRLLAVAGPRKAVYLTAVFTGLRRGELEQLDWSDIHVDDTPEPFIEVRASTTKNHKKATIKLHADVIPALRAWRAGKGGKDGRVFRVPTIETFREDLKRASIPYRDAMGRVADFHSLRVTLCTNLHKAGVPERVAMEIMRHSDRRLTDKVYTDASSLHTWSAIKMLPSMTEALSPGVSPILVGSGTALTVPVTQPIDVPVEETPAVVGETHDLLEEVTKGQDEKWRAQQELNLQPLVP